jgi:hypothetical protein
MTQQYQNQSSSGKHPSFQNKTTPILQLLGRLTPFNNGARTGSRDFSKTTPASGSAHDTSRTANRTQYQEEEHHYYEDDNVAYTNSASPQQKPRHVNSKARESQLFDVLTHSQPESINDHAKQESMDKAYIDRTNKAQWLIGGQTAGNDIYRTTTQTLNSGEQNSNKKKTSKKILGSQNADLMISPITGKLVANYGGWREKNAEKEAYEKAAEGAGNSSSEIIDPLLERVRTTLKARGANGILGMARLFWIWIRVGVRVS